MKFKITAEEKEMIEKRRKAESGAKVKINVPAFSFETVLSNPVLDKGIVKIGLEELDDVENSLQELIGVEIGKIINKKSLSLKKVSPQNYTVEGNANIFPTFFHFKIGG